jgi:hypothetical protein
LSDLNYELAILQYDCREAAYLNQRLQWTADSPARPLSRAVIPLSENECEMYKNHSSLIQPKNTLQRLWRYLTINRLTQIIDDDALFFPHISMFSDLWEGLLSEKTKNKLFNSEYKKYKDAKTARLSVDDYEKHKESFFINCWHMNNYESYLMWKVYANKECAIQTNYERLVASFEGDVPMVHGGIVEYIDYEREDFPLGNVFTAVSHKDLPYQDEKEFRLLFWSEGKENQNFAASKPGIKIKVNVSMLLEKTYVNPARIERDQIERLKRKIEHKGIDCEIKTTRIREKEV